MITQPRTDIGVEISWQSLLRLVELAGRAGQTILAHMCVGCERKADGSPVTAADRDAQAVICEGLAEWDPSVPIVAEESALPDLTSRRSWRRYWLVDPLDGTKEFIAGRPDYTVNIALIEDGEPVMGVVGAPAMDVIYWAGRGLGSWRQEGKARPTRLCACPPDPGAGVRIVESRSHPSPQLDDFLRELHVTERLQVGSSLKFCWLADARADCYPRFGPTMSWDVAAGDCVFRYAAPGLQPHPSPLSYDPAEFRQGPFVIGFVPDRAGDRTGNGHDREVPPPDTRTPGSLIVHRADPLNAEPVMHDWPDAVTTPTASAFVRCHFSIPDLAPECYRLRVGGLVERSLNLRLDELQLMPSQTRLLTIGCAGNGRSFVRPSVGGEPWGFGAVATAHWTGVPLAHLLQRSGVRKEAGAVLFRGADSGVPEGQSRPVHFERSLDLDQVSADDVLLAWGMNGEPLTREHGSPLRVVVAGWYGMAWVKWLTEIELIAEPFTGTYQAERYWYEWMRDGQIVREPVTRQAVHALIVAPAPAQTLSGQGGLVRGVAWSGVAPIARVEIAVGDEDWQPASLTGPAHVGVWQQWHCRLDTLLTGCATLRVRATDAAGRTQTEQPVWNRFGYGHNAIHAVTVHLT